MPVTAPTTTPTPGKPESERTKCARRPARALTRWKRCAGTECADGAAVSSASKSHDLGTQTAPISRKSSAAFRLSIRPATRPCGRTPQPEAGGSAEAAAGSAFLGRREKKPEPHAGRAGADAAPAATPRATAQVMTARRGARAAARCKTPQSVADDLFPEHKKDDQFEIPAFLRRQTN